MPTATSAASRALPRGLQIRHRRRWRPWLGGGGVVVAGIAMAPMLYGASAIVVLGGVAVLVAIGAAAYRLALGLAVLAFTYPFDLTTWLGPLKVTTSAALMGVLVAVWLVAVVTGDRPLWVRTPLDLPVLLFAVATALSVVGFGGYMQNQLVALTKAAGGLLIFCIATQSPQDRRDVWLVVGAVVSTGLIQAAGLTLQVLDGSQIISEQSRATGTVIDANLFAGYLVLVTPLAMAAGLGAGWRWAWLPTGLAALVFCIALLATLSRSGWLGILVSGAVLALFVSGRRRELALIGGAITIILLVGGVTGPIAERLGPDPDGPVEMLSSRWNVWTAGLSIFIHHPLFGVGVDNFQNYYVEYDPTDAGLNHAHNLFINIAAERGILGLAAFVSVLVILFGSLRRTVSTLEVLADRLLVAGVLAALGGYLAHSLLEVSYYDYKILLLFWLLASIGAVTAAWQPATESDAPPSITVRRLHPQTRASTDAH